MKISSPAFIGLAGTSLTVIGGLVGAWIQGSFERDKAIELQRYKVQGELELEEKRFEANKAAAEDKLEAELILRALETADDTQATRRLLLVAELGLIPKHKEAVLKRAKEAEESPDTRSIPGFGTPSGPLADIFQPQSFVSDKQFYPAEDDAIRKANYYAGLPAAGAPSFDSLSALVRDTHRTSLNYRKARFEFLYPTIDRHRDGTAHAIYGGQVLLEGAVNAESVVPNSWFNKAEPMRSDLHNLFITDAACNSFRSNIRYADVGDATGVRRENCGKRTSEGFEPFANKGVVARATLYFLVRYPELIGDSAREYQVQDLETLLRWHREEPPSTYERRRNYLIQAIQGNRNPFVDFPEWAIEVDLRQGFGSN